MYHHDKKKWGAAWDRLDGQLKTGRRKFSHGPYNPV